MALGEEVLKAPTTVNRTSDKWRTTVLRVDFGSGTIRVEGTRGTGTGAGYAAHANDNRTFRNLPDDDEGKAQPQEYDVVMAGTALAEAVRAAGAAMTTEDVLAEFARGLLKAKNVI